MSSCSSSHSYFAVSPIFHRTRFSFIFMTSAIKRFRPSRNLYFRLLPRGTIYCSYQCWLFGFVSVISSQDAFDFKSRMPICYLGSCASTLTYCCVLYVRLKCVLCQSCIYFFLSLVLLVLYPVALCHRACIIFWWLMFLASLAKINLHDSFDTTSIFFTWSKENHTDQLYSATEQLRARAVVLSIFGSSPHSESTRFSAGCFWY